MANEYMVDGAYLTAIADAIRAKTGSSAAMTLSEMPTKIENMSVSAANHLSPTDFPDYLRDEVLEVVNKVRNVQTDESITFIALADSHYVASQELNFYDEETNKGVIQANQAAKTLAHMLNVDFIAHLGDVSCGDKTTTPEMLQEQIEGFVSYFKEASSELPMFMVIGNHDTGIYYHNNATDGNVHTMTGEYLYKNFTAHSASADTVISGQEYGGYCYRDFADKKLRVYMLNTSECLAYNQIDNSTLASQRDWFANSLIELNAKSDASDWSFVLLCHYPADYGSNLTMSQVLKAYVEGSSINITNSYNFSGNNDAKFIAQFHGHIHNFLVDKLSVYENGSKVTYDAWRVCVPNGQFNRDNYYTSLTNYPEIDFSETTSYPKTVDTANGTSFVVNVINPSEEIIYSFCYGAGYDRTIGYAATVYYNIQTSATNATISNDATAIAHGETYTATVTPDDGYNIHNVSVLVGGVEMSSTAYVDGVITIAEVTGDIIITVTTAKQVNYTNLVTTSIDTSGAIYNGTGYKDGYRIGSSGSESAYSGYVATGYIALPADGNSYTLRLGGTDISWDTYGCQLCLYDSNFTKLSTSMNYNQIGNANFGTWDTTEDNTAFAVTFYDASDGMNSEFTTAAYMRISAKGSGANMVVTINNPIE